MTPTALLTTPPFADVTLFNYSDIPVGYTHRSPLHHFHQLDVILDGEVEVRIEDDPAFRGTSGMAWLIPPLMRHAYQSDSGYRLGSFKFHLAPRFWPLFGPGFRTFLLSPYLMEAVEVAGRRFDRQSELISQQVTSVAVLCLIDCLDKSECVSGDGDNLDGLRQVLWPLLERIGNDPHAQWSVHRMAAECHLSPEYFSRSFHRIIGRTPQQYLLETRMRASAADLFAVPPCSIKEIADRAGYSSVPSFTRAFKQFFQLSPAAYRSTYRDSLDRLR